METSISPADARELALSFLERQGLDRKFVENASLKPEDAEIMVDFFRDKEPEKILEIGTFVGVSSVVLARCFCRSQMICVDPGLPVGLLNHLCVNQFEIPDYSQSMLEFVEAALLDAGVRDRVRIYQGFFSCCFPDSGDRKKAIDYGVDLQAYPAIGLEVCQTHSPFDAVFLDADHRSEAVLSDLRLLSSHIAPDGIIILHDMGEDFWGMQVREGVERFLSEHPEWSLERRGVLGKLRLTSAAIAPK